MTSPQQEHDEYFAEMYRQYSDAIFRHCYFRVFRRERAKELMQDTFMRAWEYLCKGNKIDNMRAFLYRVANNLIVDEVRKKKEMSLDELQEKGIDPSYDDTRNMQDRIEEQKILLTFCKMEKPYRDVLVMRYVDGLPPSEIADILGERQYGVSSAASRNQAVEDAPEARVSFVVHRGKFGRVRSSKKAYGATGASIHRGVCGSDSHRTGDRSGFGRVAIVHAIGGVPGLDIARNAVEAFASDGLQNGPRGAEIGRAQRR